MSEIIGNYTSVGLFPEDVWALYRAAGGTLLGFEELFRERPERVHGTLAFFAAMPREFSLQLAGMTLDASSLAAVRAEMKRASLHSVVPAIRRDPKKAEARGQVVTLELLRKLKALSTSAIEDGNKRLYCYVVAKALDEPN